MPIDPKLQYCKCGYTWRPRMYHKLLMLLFGRYVFTCPQCHTRMTFRLINHVVKVETVEVKGKEELWRKG